MVPAQQLSHLDRLEAESLHILREVVAEFRNPVMLYSIGKGGTVADEGLGPRVHINPEGVRAGVGSVSHGATVHTDILGPGRIADAGLPDAASGSAQATRDKS